MHTAHARFGNRVTCQKQNRRSDDKGLRIVL